MIKVCVCVCALLFIEESMLAMNHSNKGNHLPRQTHTHTQRERTVLTADDWQSANVREFSALLIASQCLCVPDDEVMVDAMIKTKGCLETSAHCKEMSEI